MTLQEYLAHGPFTFPGGYTLHALVDDGEAICFDCCKEDGGVHEGGPADGWRFEDVFVHWEGPPMFCAHCNKALESEYGDPDAPDNAA